MPVVVAALATRAHVMLAAAITALVTLAVTGCSGAGFFVANAPTVFGSFQRAKDLAYGSGPRQGLDVYYQSNTRDRPVVIFWYGGSWTQGEKSRYKFVGAALAERGFVAVLPNYRLYPEVKFPEFIADGAHAVAWAERHAREFGGDPHKIVLMGHSAGAHMAAFLALNAAALTQGGAEPHDIVGLVGLSGPYALDPNSDTLRTIFAAPYALSDWQPVRFVSPHSPPTLLIHGQDDKIVAIAHAEKLRDALRQQGVRVETDFYAGKGHSDTVASFSLAARKRTPALERSVAFIESVTGKSGPSR